MMATPQCVHTGELTTPGRAVLLDSGHRCQVAAEVVPLKADPLRPVAGAVLALAGDVV